SSARSRKQRCIKRDGPGGEIRGRSLFDETADGEVSNRSAFNLEVTDRANGRTHRSSIRSPPKLEERNNDADRCSPGVAPQGLCANAARGQSAERDEELAGEERHQRRRD